MARIRTVKPEFFTSLTIASLPVEARLTFVGLWTHCDDEGRCVADARLVRAAIWPLDERLMEDVVRDLRLLTESSLIAHYEVNGRRYFAVRGWREHQRINRPTASKLPPLDRGVELPFPPPNPAVSSTDGSSPVAHGELSEDSVRTHDRKGKERKGTGNRDSATRVAAATATTLDLDVPEAAPAETAQTLVAEWIDHCGERPPGRLVGQVAKEVGALLEEGIAYDAVRAGLAAWHQKRLNPSAIASVVHEIRVGPPTRPRSRQEAEQQATNEMFDRALARAVARDQAEAAANGALHA